MPFSEISFKMYVNSNLINIIQKVFGKAFPCSNRVYQFVSVLEIRRFYEIRFVERRHVFDLS